MRVLIVTDSLESSDGPGRHASNLVRALAAVGGDRIDVAIPRRHPPVADEISSICAVHRLLPSRHVFYLRRFLFIPLVGLTALRLVRLARRAELVHAVKDYPFSFIAAVAAWIARRPLVVNAYGTFAVLPYHYVVHRSCVRFVYRRAARILCLSNYTEERLRRHEMNARTTPLPMAVDPRFLSWQRGSRREGPPYVLSVGLIRSRKGFDISIAAFLEIAGEHPELEYLLAGRYADDNYYHRLRTLIDTHPNGDRVRLLGEVEEARLPGLYAGCELFVLTPRADALGRFEGLGLVYLEAAALGKPAIGTLGCGAEDAIVDGVTGRLVPPGDVGATAACLRELLRRPDLCARLGAAAHTRAATLTWSRAAAAVREMYQDALRSPLDQ